MSLIMLNISPDHLERHGTMEAYVERQAEDLSIIRGSRDWAIVGFDDLAHPVHRHVTHGKWAAARRTSISSEYALGRGVSGMWKDGLFDSLSGKAVKAGDLRKALFACPVVTITRTLLPPLPPAARLVVEPNTIMEAILSFPGLPHRLEQLRLAWRAFAFVNDSKATNAQAAEQALESLFHASIGSLAGARKAKALVNLEPYFPACRESLSYRRSSGCSSPAP